MEGSLESTSYSHLAEVLTIALEEGKVKGGSEEKGAGGLLRKT